MMRLTRSSPNKRLHYALAIVGALIILVGLLFDSSVARAYDLATKHLPEAYSELYFNNVATLPTYAPPGKTEHISFTIINHEGKPFNYSYVISENYLNHNSTFNSAEFTLANGASKVGDVTFMLPAADQSVQIKVSLTGTSQYIDLVSRS